MLGVLPFSKCTERLKDKIAEERRTGPRRDKYRTQANLENKCAGEFVVEYPYD